MSERRWYRTYSDLEARLRGVEVPGSPEAGERAWDAVGAAFASRRAARAPARRIAPGLALAVVLGVLMLAVGGRSDAAGRRGARLRRPRARRRPGAPAPGADRPAPARSHAGDLAARRVDRGARRIADAARAVRRARRGRRAGSSSSRGAGADVRAVAPDGAVHWTLRTPGPRRRRRVVAGRLPGRLPAGGRPGRRGGRRDRAARAVGLGRAGGAGLAAGRAAHARLGRPGGPRRRPRRRLRRARLALALRRGRGAGAVVVGRRAVGARASRRTACDWRDPAANRVSRVRLPSGDRAVAAAWAPRGRRLAVVARGASGDLTASWSRRAASGSRTGPCSRRRDASRRRHGRPTGRACWCGGRMRMSGCCCPRWPAGSVSGHRRRRRAARARGIVAIAPWRGGSGACRSCAGGAARVGCAGVWAVP